MKFWYVFGMWPSVTELKGLAKRSICLLSKGSRVRVWARDGTIRVLGYDNRAQAGNYAAALKLAAETDATPSAVATRRSAL
jgi:hypothetical protein